MGIVGEWGSGKTSVINLAIGPIRERPGYRIVEFNPWLFSGTPQLLEHYFTELRRQLESSGDAKLIRIAGALEEYSEAIDPLRFLPGLDKTWRLTRFISRMLRQGEVPKSAEAQRQHVATLLAERDELLLVVIDDIDRLRDHEVSDVMRLVRLVADFPNTVYVLAYDSQRVAEAVAKTPAVGHEYLEKIVQVTHEIPSIVGEQLSDLAIDRINAVVGDVSQPFDREHWSKLFLAFRKYLKLPRDVARLVNHARAPIAQLRSDVDVADILALEALRLFERDFWRGLREVRTALTDTRSTEMWFSDEPEPDGDRLKTLVQGGIDPRTLQEVVLELFPAAGRYLGSTRFGEDFLAQWQRDRRVAHPTVLGSYLARQIAPTEVSAAVVDEALTALDDGDKLKSLTEALTDQQVSSLLSRLEAFEDSFPPNVAPAIPVLYEITRRLPDEPGVFGIRPSLRVARLVLRLLRNRGSQSVASIVQDALPALNLSDREELINLVGYRDGVGHRLVDETVAAQLEETLVDQVLRAAPEALAAEPNLGGLSVSRPVGGPKTSSSRFATLRFTPVCSWR